DSAQRVAPPSIRASELAGQISVGDGLPARRRSRNELGHIKPKRLLHLTPMGLGYFPHWPLPLLSQSVVDFILTGSASTAARYERGYSSPPKNENGRVIDAAVGIQKARTQSGVDGLGVLALALHHQLVQA